MTKSFSRPIEKVTILADEAGICDVIFSDGRKDTHLSEDTDYCNEGEAWIESATFTVLPEVPLIGFHGHIVSEKINYGGFETEDFFLGSLGLIMYDNFQPICQTGAIGPVYPPPVIPGDSAAEQAEYVMKNEST